MKVYVSIPKGSAAEKFFLPSNIKNYLQSLFEVKWLQGSEYLSPDDFSLAVKDANIVMTGWGHPTITYDMVKDTPVRLIAHTGGSVGDLADPSLFANGIKVISGNRLFAESVAEGTLAYILAGLRRLPDQIAYTKSGGWQKNVPSTEGLLDQSVGLVGFGAISLKLIEMLQVFRVKIKIYSSHEISHQLLELYHAEQVSLKEIFATCKIVSVHAALTEKTIGMIGKECFDLLQDGALFINTARGKILRENDMIKALEENRFSAVLDVFSEEPLAVDSPLRMLNNVYCFPHTAGPTHDRYAYITKHIIDNMEAFKIGLDMELEISASAAARMTLAM